MITNPMSWAQIFFLYCRTKKKKKMNFGIFIMTFMEMMNQIFFFCIGVSKRMNFEIFIFCNYDEITIFLYNFV